MNESTMPPDLSTAMATEPLWLQSWIMILVAAHLIAIFFIVVREDSNWRVRIEPIAIIVSFFAAGALMNWMYSQVGYVRLLGLAHIAFWTPVYIWILTRRKAIGIDSIFGKYVHAYLGIAGISLVIDAIDVTRYLLGDGNLI